MIQNGEIVTIHVVEAKVVNEHGETVGAYSGEVDFIVYGGELSHCTAHETPVEWSEAEG